ncbi:extracellular solute-binding protein [Ensifer adhaerens]|uniref:extracellular solute-binding protein n=1 Tax=Ensifer adhaerens TaxID=106592 RepID=UPI001CBB79F2|nr:extracellular solute-binding protein [Ensifer adhaerens]MBZ7926642.1 extracellular solute-binding protein [Ensifer adhaerens]UAX97028.1 extracellular solute-binding protein [Ensifer adhaerens]
MTIRFAPSMLVACLAATGANAAGPVIYTTNPIPAVEAVQAVIQEKAGLSTGIITGGSGVLLRRVEAEKAAPQGDVFWSSSANTMGAFKEVLEPYSSPELEAVPKELRVADDYFQPANVHVVTLMVNADQLNGATAPTDWKDLADPAWKGRIILPDPANSSTGYTIVWGLSKLLDGPTYKALVSNLVVSSSSSAVPKGVAMGEYAAGITFETNSYSYVDGGQTEISIVYPSSGTFTTPEYAALIKGAPAGEAARKAIDALLSREAQIELLKVAFRRPSRTDIQVSDYVKLPELASIKVFRIDEEEAARGRDAFLTEWAALPKAGSSK